MMVFSQLRTVIVALTLFLIALSGSAYADELPLEEEMSTEEGIVDHIDFETLLKPDVEALSLLKERFGSKHDIEISQEKGVSLCLNLPAKRTAFQSCVCRLLLRISEERHLDPDLHFYKALSLMGELVQGEAVFKRVLFSLLKEEDDGVRLAALKSLQSFELLDYERRFLSQFFNQPSEAIMHAALKVLTEQQLLSTSEVFSLTYPYGRGFSAYQLVVEAFSNLSEASFEELRQHVYSKDPLLRAWIAEAMGRRPREEYEEELTKLFLFSFELLEILRSEQTEGFLDLLESHVQEFSAIESAYSFSSRAADPEKAARLEVERIVAAEELMLTRVAFALFAIGTESSLETARKILPLVERKLDTDPYFERMLLAQLFCSLPDNPVDLRREGMLRAVSEKYLEAEAIIDCLAMYRDPELVGLFKAGLDSEIPAIEAASLKALFAAWDILPAEEKGVICQHQEFNRIASSVNDQNVTKYCS